MTLEDRASLAAVFRTAQALTVEAQRWYTAATGDPGIPPAITALRNALVEPALQTFIERLVKAA
jgi:hypothetical protein